jgi:type II secretory pathway component PulM
MKMPRLSKDEIKKCILSLLGLIVLLYCYSTFLLRPLNQARARMITAMADREKNLAEGKKTLQEAAHLEETAGNSVQRSTTLGLAMILKSKRPRRSSFLTCLARP